VLNSLLAATTTTGFGGRTLPALSADRLLEVLAGPATPLVAGGEGPAR
jgi:D-aminopeptidase